MAVLYTVCSECKKRGEVELRIIDGNLLRRCPECWVRYDRIKANQEVLTYSLPKVVKK